MPLLLTAKAEVGRVMRVQHPEASGGESFADTLKGFAGDAVKTLQDGEKAAAAGATGKVDIASVVTAMNSAELMLQTVVGIRDKVIAAYQDITKTSILNSS